MVETDTVTLFADLVRRDDESIRLPAAALAMARVQYPRLDVEAYLDQLDLIAARAMPAVKEARSAERKLVALRRFLFREIAFRGNEESYYDPRNTFLNDVLDRRLGIPITLSLVYIEVAAACDLPAEGIGFPGHFLVRDVTTGHVIDPFRGGLRLDGDGCRRLLAAQGIDPAQWTDELLRPVSKRQFLRRMINNIARYYAETRDGSRLEKLEAMAAVLGEQDDSERAPLLQ